MKLIFRMLVAAMCCSMAFAISSCNKSDDDFDYDYHEIEVKIEGLSSSPGMLFQRIVDVPPSGGEFTVESAGKYADKGYLMAMSLDGKVEKLPEAFSNGAPYFVDVDVFSGTWGSIKYLSGKAPFKLKVSVGENNTGKDRRIDFQLGEDRIYTILTINQLPAIEIPGVPEP